MPISRKPACSRTHSNGRVLRMAGLLLTAFAIGTGQGCESKSGGKADAYTEPTPVTLTVAKRLENA